MASSPVLTFIGSRRRVIRRLSGGALGLLAGLGLLGITSAAWAADPSPVAASAGDSPLATPAASPRATAARVEKQGEATRIVFDLDRPLGAPATAYAMAEPDRIVVDLPAVDFRVSPEVGHAAAKPAEVHAGRRHAPAPALTSLVRSFRFGQFAQGRSRIVVDLAEPARVVQAASRAGAGGQAQFVVELARTDASAFRSAARASAKALAALSRPAAPDPVPSGGDESKPLIALDAGHGGVDTGALGPGGIEEKNITLGFAETLKAKLESTGRFRVLLTRGGDVYVPLEERVRIARRAGAALFLSVHADTLSEDHHVSGATVYTVSERASDAEAARIAAHENEADSAAGVDKSESADDVSGILADLTRRETRAYSHTFARSIVSYWRQAGRLNKNPQRAAGFVVLKAPDVPSVLLELGYLSNKGDVRELTSPDWRDKAAASVEKSIETFFSAQPETARAISEGPIARLDPVHAASQ